MCGQLGWDLNSILEKEKKLDFFVNVTVPAAKKRNESIPHLLIVCRYPRLAKFILSELTALLSDYAIIEVQTVGTQPSDVCALFTRIKDNSVIYLNNGKSVNDISPDALEVFSEILSNFSLDIPVGKGVRARTCHLEFPRFTLWTWLDGCGKTLQKFKYVIDNTIEISSYSDKDFCMMEIQFVALENNMKLDIAAIEYIADRANGDYRKTGKYVRWIRDYILAKDLQMTLIPYEFVDEILTLFS